MLPDDSARQDPRLPARRAHEPLWPDHPGPGAEAVRLAAEGLAVVQALLKQDPGNELGRWALSILAGRPAEFPTGLQDLSCRVLATIPQ